MNAKGFLSKDITVKDMILHRGDIHHLFPKDYLKKNNLSRSQYNQVANYVYMQTEINIKVGNKAPNIYFDELKNQCETGVMKYGGITDFGLLKTNLDENDIPEIIMNMTIEKYQEFLEARRKMMAEKLRKYYEAL